MANPFNPHMPAGLFRHAAIANQRRRPGLQLQLLLNSAAFLTSMAASFVAKPSAADDPAFLFMAFFLFLLGVWLALVALVADRFPRAAPVGAAMVARTIRYYFAGGAR